MKFEAARRPTRISREICMALVVVFGTTRIPIEMETMRQWAARQEWRLTNKPRPPAG